MSGACTCKIDFHSRKKKQWKSVGAVNCLVNNPLQNIFFCVQQKKESRTSLEQQR